MTLLFNEGLLQVNRSNGYYTDPLEELDFEEKKLVIHEILNCEPVNGAIELTGCIVKEVKDWRGRKLYEKVGPYEAERYLSAGVEVRPEIDVQELDVEEEP